MSEQTIALPDAAQFGTEVLRAAGMTAQDSETVVHHLTQASLRGVDSHGLIRLLVYARRVRDGGIVSPAPIEVVSDNGSVVLLDGGGGAGQVVGQHATEILIERAGSTGIGAVGMRNSNHLGALASYGMAMAGHGLVSISMTNASPRMAPAGGAEPLIGNNPWSIVIPAGDRPLVMDMANSVVAVGKMRLLKARGKPLPAGWARDRDGVPTTDPDTAISGLLEPIAGYKGYVIALMLDVLAGVLTGSGFGPDVGALTKHGRPGRTGHFFLAFRVDDVMPREEFYGRMRDYLDRIRNSRRAVGSDEVLAPGDLESRVEDHRREHGIPVTVPLATALREAATEFGVATPPWLADGLPVP